MRITFAPGAAVVLGACLVLASRAVAQDAPRRATDQLCLGFTFGAFTPKLDWAKAGHAPIRPGSTDSAPDGRDWASDQALPNDSSLYLFPAWWPVGIWVELATRAPADGDTVSGKATALVARGDIPPRWRRSARGECRARVQRQRRPLRPHRTAASSGRDHTAENFSRDHWNWSESAVYTSPFAPTVPPLKRGGDPLSTDLRTARIAGSR